MLGETSAEFGPAIVLPIKSPLSSFFPGQIDLVVRLSSLFKLAKSAAVSLSFNLMLL